MIALDGRLDPTDHFLCGHHDVSAAPFAQWAPKEMPLLLYSK